MLITMEVCRRARGDDGGSDVSLRFRIRGSEVPDQEFLVRRLVTAMDQDNLESPLVYAVEVLEGEAAEVTEGQDLSPADAHVLRALKETDMKVKAIGDNCAAADAPLRRETIQKSLQKLEELGLVISSEGKKGGPKLWSKV